MKRGRRGQRGAERDRQSRGREAVSRSAVLDLLSVRSRPLLSTQQILARLGAGHTVRRTLARLLRELVREGRVEKVDGRYRARRDDGLVEGELAGVDARGGGSVLDDTGELWRVPDVLAARRGERVWLQPLGAAGSGRAELVHVVAPARREWIGIFHARGRGGVASVTPYRDDVDWSFRVPARERGDARDGDVVRVVLARQNLGPGPKQGPTRRGEPVARVVERLGEVGEAEVDFRTLIWRHRLPLEFPEAVLREAAAADASDEAERGIAGSEESDRIDLRTRPFVTIDPATARDHDDAVEVERVPGGGYRLRVAIADVSHYVPAGSALDREALLRGNSVYFPDRAIPMLPERLSSELCSLVPGVDRLALVVVLLIDGRGGVQEQHFMRAVIRSRARLDYAGAARVMMQASEDGLDDELTTSLRALGELAEVLRARRFAGGSIDFEMPEGEIHFDERGRPSAIERGERTLAHRAIEEAMLVANRAVAEHLANKGEPSVFRVHEPPSRERLEALARLLRAFGLLEDSTALDAHALERALERVAGRPEAPLIQRVALRSMRRARYGAESVGHYGLGFGAYLHFTSPIRRYGDLVVHRALLASLTAGSRDAGAVDEDAVEQMERVAARISQRERVAMAVEREALQLARCHLMGTRLGETFEGSVTGVAPHGLYVTLDEPFVEGLVHAASLPGELSFDRERLRLVARRSRAGYRLGDRVEVRLSEVDPVKGWINFELLSHRRPGSPAAASSTAASSSARRSHSR